MCIFYFNVIFFVKTKKCDDWSVSLVEHSPMNRKATSLISGEAQARLSLWIPRRWEGPCRRHKSVFLSFPFPSTLYTKNQIKNVKTIYPFRFVVFRNNWNNVFHLREHSKMLMEFEIISPNKRSVALPRNLGPATKSQSYHFPVPLGHPNTNVCNDQSVTGILMPPVGPEKLSYPKGKAPNDGCV